MAEEAESLNVQTPRRVTLSRKKGWRMPADTVKVCRPGPWGNPHRVGPRVDAEEAVARFRVDALNWPMERWMRAMRELGGKNLACWCREGEPCHADVLLEIANPPRNRQEVEA